MSKIGRKPIAVTSAAISISGNIVSVKGKNAEFSHELPSGIEATFNDSLLTLTIVEKTRRNKELWGLHRALLANKITGAEKGFERLVKIQGLGYKAQLSGKKMTFTLGFSHKVDYTLPDGVTVEIDKTGQKLVFKSSDKFLLGNACDTVCAFKRPEPYKGTGIMRDDAVIIRKAGKTKGA